MGNSRSALKMIMEELHDVDKAIEFAKEQDDGELWEDLILYSIDKPRKQKRLQVMLCVVKCCSRRLLGVKLLLCMAKRIYSHCFGNCARLHSAAGYIVV